MIGSPDVAPARPWAAVDAASPSLLVPLYVHPAVDGDAWQRAARAAGLLAAVVVNVDDGPGTVQDSVLGAAVDRLHTAGVATVGYLDTGYGRVSPEVVRAQAQRWAGWYGVGGLFVDQVSSLAQDRDHCRRVVAAGLEGVGPRTGPVVLNFGTEPHPDYAESAVADLLITFEGTWADYRRYRPSPLWRRPDVAARCGHLVHAVPPDEVSVAVEQARRWAVGGVGVSCGTGANPWDGWPPQLVAAVAGAPDRRPRPGPGPPALLARGGRR